MHRGLRRHASLIRRRLFKWNRIIVQNGCPHVFAWIYTLLCLFCKLLNRFILENAAALRRILHLPQTLSNCETCYNTASGCPCLGLRATPLDVGKTVRRLPPAVFRFTGALAPCCGHGLDHQRRQARQRSDKPHHLDNQVHEQLTSFPQGRRCQHTGLIPLTTPNYITKSNICSLFAHTDSDRKAA